MSFTAEYMVLSLLATLFFIFTSLKKWRPSISYLILEKIKSRLRPLLSFFISAPEHPSTDSLIQDIAALSNCHDTAALLTELIQKDGAASWPPRTNYDYCSWPASIRPYLDVYHEMKALLPAERPSLVDVENRERIDYFRATHTKLLADRIDLDSVMQLLQAAESGQWDVFPREIYNSFWCCVAWHRHAYRWGTVPVVAPAQLETTLTLPPSIIHPWSSLQTHFGLASAAGNIMSNIVLNFSSGLSEPYQFRINTSLPSTIQSSEEEFSRVLRQVEASAIPVYKTILLAIISHARGDLASCLRYTRDVGEGLRPVLTEYYDRVHDKRIAKGTWLSHVQGFYAWGLERRDEQSGNFVKDDGLSGNQVMLFQVVDAFLGLEQYLSEEVRIGVVPRLQREFCDAVKRASFRGCLGAEGLERELMAEMDEIVKKMRVFRSAHRSRAKEYLLVPAPERLPMTAGKSLLKADMEQSLEYLDGFMVGRIRQTV